MPEPRKTAPSHQSKPEDFTQTQNLILEDTSLSLQARMLYVFISKFVGWDDVKAGATYAEAYPSTAELAALMGYRKWTKKLSEYRDELRDAGLLSWIGRVTEDGGQTSNLYTVTRKLQRTSAPSVDSPTPSGVDPLPPVERGPSPSPDSPRTPTQGYEIEPLEREPLKKNQGTNSSEADATAGDRDRDADRIERIRQRSAWELTESESQELRDAGYKYLPIQERWTLDRQSATAGSGRVEVPDWVSVDNRALAVAKRIPNWELAKLAAQAGKRAMSSKNGLLRSILEGESVRPEPTAVSRGLWQAD